MADRTYLATIGRPSVDKAFSGLKTITRRYKVQGEALRVANADTELFLPYATADEEFPLALLVERSIQPIGNNPSSMDQMLVEVFREFTPGEKVAVGEDLVTRDDSGRESVVRKYVALASEAETLAAAIGDLDADSKACSQAQIQKQGVGAVIAETYIASGKLSETTQITNNGCLTTVTLVYFNEVPPTPSGYSLVSSQQQGPDGVPTYTYTFALGVGRISLDVDTKNLGKLTISTVKYLNTDSGSTPAGVLFSVSTTKQDGGFLVVEQYASGAGRISEGIEYRQKNKLKLTTIRFINSDDGTTPGGTLIEDSSQTTDGYTIYSQTYSEILDDGLIEDSIEYKNNGKLVIYRRVRLDTAPDAPAATIGGTVVLVSTSQREEDGYTAFSYTWAEGVGRIQESVRGRGDGLREQTFVALGAWDIPVGAVISKDTDEIEGVTRYTATAIQTPAGASPDGYTLVYDRLVPFTYPGRAKAYSKTASNGWLAIDVFLSPPAETEVPGYVTVSYQTSNTLDSIGVTWEPKDWATIEAEWIGLNNFPGFHIEALRGYRSVSETAISETVSIWAGDAGGTMLGKVIYGGTTAVLTVTGGPPDPVGNSYTLHAEIEPAFTDTDGTVYYKKTVISTQDLPAQEDLPV